MLLTGNKCQVRVDSPRMPTWPARSHVPRRWLSRWRRWRTHPGWPRSTAALRANDLPRALFLVDQMAVVGNGTMAPGPRARCIALRRSGGHAVRGCGSRGRYRPRLSGILRPGPAVRLGGPRRRPGTPAGLSKSGSSRLVPPKAGVAARLVEMSQLDGHTAVPLPLLASRQQVTARVLWPSVFRPDQRRLVK
jgi:hypothetical protein